MIDRDVKEPLHLRRVQVDRHDAIGAAALDQVGDELGRDRRAALVLAVLPRESIVPEGATVAGNVSAENALLSPGGSC